MPLIFSTKATKVLKTEEIDRSEDLKKMVETGHKPGRAELYLDTHKKEDGSHVNEVAKEICEYENGGKEYPFLVVYEEMHRKKNKDGTRGDWVEPHARIAYE
ncbi:putative protein isoform X2 [Capsicum annuum]|uniref:uncharacterized protein LOC107843085 isoform X2 n=1 Tax=Capsicum annuum TaxID=4072 RepID=UPI0007BFEBD9|nr:uncharacterized protein LOC107843085 isoform X2 [Capsicum annuum]